jgi:hypothetical protein
MYTSSRLINQIKLELVRIIINYIIHVQFFILHSIIINQLYYSFFNSFLFQKNLIINQMKNTQEIKWFNYIYCDHHNFSINQQDIDLHFKTVKELKTIGIEWDEDKYSMNYDDCTNHLDIRICSLCRSLHFKLSVIFFIVSITSF